MGHDILGIAPFSKGYIGSIRSYFESVYNGYLFPYNKWYAGGRDGVVRRGVAIPCSSNVKAGNFTIACQRSSVVEQRFRKPRVGGSTPLAGSIY